jgi:hypothetical protein
VHLALLIPVIVLTVSRLVKVIFFIGCLFFLILGGITLKFGLRSLDRVRGGGILLRDFIRRRWVGIRMALLGRAGFFVFLYLFL